MTTMGEDLRLKVCQGWLAFGLDSTCLVGSLCLGVTGKLSWLSVRRLHLCNNLWFGFRVSW